MVYAHNNNLRSRDKHFQEVDKVIVFDTDASAKMLRQLAGPSYCRSESPHSYLVNMGDGRVHYLHANRIGMFDVRLQSCNVTIAMLIFDV